MKKIGYKTIVVDIEENTIPSVIAKIIDDAMNKSLVNFQKEWEGKNFHNVRILEKSVEKLSNTIDVDRTNITYLISFFYEIS